MFQSFNMMCLTALEELLHGPQGEILPFGRLETTFRYVARVAICEVIPPKMKDWECEIQE